VPPPKSKPILYKSPDVGEIELVWILGIVFHNTPLTYNNIVEVVLLITATIFCTVPNPKVETEDE
jgi:hypothetical protein